jgi:acyl carrier protein
MDVGDRIRAFIKQEVILNDEAELANDTPLLEGIIDSLALMQLVAFLEEEFETEIDDTEIRAENFRTVADIERLVEERIARA